MNTEHQFPQSSESPAPWKDPDIWVTGGVTLLILVMMIISFSISFPAIKAEAIRYGVAKGERLPWIVDGFIVVASGLMLWGQYRQEEEIVNLGWWGVVAGTLCTLIFNASHAPFMQLWTIDGWAAVQAQYRTIHIIFQSIYAMTAAALLAFSLHALTEMLAKIVKASQLITELITAKETAESKAQALESVKQQLEIAVQAAETAGQAAEIARQQAESAQQEAETARQQLQGELNGAEKHIQRLETQLQERELAWQVWNLLGSAPRQYFAKVMIEQAMNQKEFAELIGVPATTISRFNSFLKLEATDEHVPIR